MERIEPRLGKDIPIHILFVTQRASELASPAWMNAQLAILIGTKLGHKDLQDSANILGKYWSEGSRWELVAGVTKRDFDRIQADERAFAGLSKERPHRHEDQFKAFVIPDSEGLLSAVMFRYSLGEKPRKRDSTIVSMHEVAKQHYDRAVKAFEAKTTPAGRSMGFSEVLLFVQDEISHAIAVDPACYELHRWRGNMMLLEMIEALHKTPEPSLRSLMTKGEQALASLSLCLNLNPACKEAYAQRGGVYLSLARDAEGSMDLRLAKALSSFWSKPPKPVVSDVLRERILNGIHRKDA